MGRVINYPYQLYVILINTNTELPVYQFSKTNRLDMAAGKYIFNKRKYWFRYFKIEGNVTHDEAQKMIILAEAKSKELGTKMNIAVVDSGANLVAFLR